VTNLCNQKQIVTRGHRKLLSTLSTHTWTSQTGMTHQNIPSFHGTLSFPAKCTTHAKQQIADILCDSSFPSPPSPISQLRSTLFNTRQERWRFFFFSLSVIIVLDLRSVPPKQSSDPLAEEAAEILVYVSGCKTR